MNITSLAYVFFAFVTIIAYYVIPLIFKKVAPAKIQRIVLLIAAGVLAYSLTSIAVVVFIVLLAWATYGLGLSIERANEAKDKKKSKRILDAGLVLVVGILCFFKYLKGYYTDIYDLIVDPKNAIESMRVLLTPIGLSYYTLSIAAYLIDVSHKKHPAEHNFIDYLAFITYFPSLVEGPINLYRKIMPQIKADHMWDWDRSIMGLQRVLWGYLKKVMIADRIGVIVMGILKNEASSGLLLFWAMLLYSFQIYADFSGGIDVVMGISEVLDIKLTENFKAPLISKSVTEYWQRWHISLGEFMEKYIYYPICLNRNVMKMSKKIGNKYLQKVFSATLASVIVFVIVGIWHGTGWNYVVYGCYQAIFVSSAVLLGPVYKKMRERLHINENSASWQIFTIVRTFLILTFGRYFIKAADLNQTWGLFGRTFSGKWNIGVLFDGTLFNYGLDAKNVYLMYVCILLLIVVDICHAKDIHFRQILMKQDIAFRYFVYMAGIFALIIFGIYGPGFEAASFIYQAF